MIAGRRWAAIIAGITVAGAAAGAAAALQTDTASAGSMPVVVIDAGHGGIDAGVYGVNTAVKESDINLVIAKKLRGRFVNAGFECVMTRTTNGGLYGNTSKGFKMRDMQQRRRTIEESGADMVISIHQNTCPLPSRRGSHVFYEEGGEILAYLRVLPAGSMFPDAAGIGRVIAKRRGEGLGARVLAAGIAAARRSFGAGKIKLEAQCYAAGFYEKAGFVRRGEPFDEDGIEHVLMELET